MTNFFFVRRMISKAIKNMQDSDFWQKNTFIMKKVWCEVYVKSLKSICLFFPLWDNLTSSSINDFFWSNYANFGFAPQTQFFIYIFFIVTLFDCVIKNQSPYLCLFYSLRDNLTSSSTNGLLWSNFGIFCYNKKCCFCQKSLSCIFLIVLEIIQRKKKFVTRDVTNFSPIVIWAIVDLKKICLNIKNFFLTGRKYFFDCKSIFLQS